MSVSPQAPSGQETPLWTRLALDAPFWIAYSDLQRRLEVSQQPFPSVVSRVENDQFQDGSLDNLGANNSTNPHQNNNRLNTEGCECSRDASGRLQVCNYCSDSTFYGVVARAFDLREKPPNQDLPLYQRTREPVEEQTFIYQSVTHNDGIMNEYGGLILSPPPLTPTSQPNQYGDPAILEFDPVPHYYLRINDYDRSFEIPNDQNQRSDREAPDQNDEHIRRMFEEQEQEDPHLPAEGLHIDAFHLPLFEETNEDNASEDTLATTVEQSQLPVTRRRSRSRSTSAEALSMRVYDPQTREKSQPHSTPGHNEGSSSLIEPPATVEQGQLPVTRKRSRSRSKQVEALSMRAIDPQTREESQPHSTPGHNEDSSSFIEPAVTQTIYITSEGQISDCYRCDRPNSWENMVACDSDHGSRVRWFHLSCAGLTAATAPSAKQMWLCEDCPQPDVLNENDHNLYQDYTEEPTDSDGQADSGENNKGKQKQDPKITESRSSTHSYDSVDSDDYTSSSKNRKRKRGQELEFMPDSEGDDSDDGAYSGNSHNRRRQHEPKAKQSSGPSKGPAHSQDTPATSGLTTQQSIAATTPGPAAQPSNSGQPPDKFPPSTANKVCELMKEAIEAKQFNEKKFQMISDGLAERYGIELSPGAIKNYWNRKGRATYGVDERKKPNPDKMVTGVQSPEDRRKARQQAKAADQPQASVNGRKRQKRD